MHSRTGIVTVPLRRDALRHRKRLALGAETGIVFTHTTLSNAIKQGHGPRSVPFSNLPFSVQILQIG
jgi:hypothetical protein